MTWTDPADFVDGDVLLEEQLDALSSDLQYLHHLAHASGQSVIAAGAWTTSSAAYVDWNGTSPCATTFVKRGGVETGLYVELKTQFTVQPATGHAIFAIQVGTTDYANGFRHVVNTAGEHTTAVEDFYIPNLAAGTYAIKLRVQADGTHSVDIDGNDWAQIKITELEVST